MSDCFRHLWRQKINPKGRKQAEKGKKERLNYELQQIEIIGSERGSHRNGNENPSSGRQATAEEKKFYPIFWFRGIKEVLNIGTDKTHGGDKE